LTCPKQAGLIPPSTLLRTLTPQYPSQATRSLSISAPLHKKAGKANKAHARTDSTPPVTNPGAPTPTDIAYDVSGLENQILKAIEELTHELRQLRSSGKVSNEVVEAIKVQLGTKGGPDGHKETVKMGDIAQVFSRGRIMNVVVGEESVCLP
jgi:ribosome recycling factor